MLETGVVPRRRRPWIVIAIGVAIAIVVTAIFVGTDVFGSDSRPAPPAGPPFNLRLVGVACPDDHAWVCGGIRVPLDRNSPVPGSISLQYRVLPRRLTTEESAGTIVVVNGGPGYSSMSQHAWAKKAFRPLLSDHDLLLVDNRGTGASGALDCPKAQQSLTPAAIAQCSKILGSRVDDYSTVAAVDDLEAVLSHLHSRAVDLYGESYGTFFAQVFALRHPEHLERLVLDSALPLDPDPWKVASLPAALAGVRATCGAHPACRASGDPIALIAKVLSMMRAEVPRGYLSNGARELASELENAGRHAATYRELPSALNSYIAGDDVPLFRLFDENQSGAFGAGTEPARYSSGLLLASACADEPQPFDLHASVSVQRRQLDASYVAHRAANARTFLPFTPKEVLNSGNAQVFCLGWPAPASPPLGLRHQTFPDVPTLVLEGGLDTVTPPPPARAVAREFRHGRFVVVPFVGHETGLNDPSGCAVKIAVAFIRSTTIATACRSQLAAPDQVDAFPKTFAEEAPIHPIDVDEAAGLSADDLRTVGIARDAIADVMRRWGPLGFYEGNGLRGGTFITTSPRVKGEFRVRLSAIAWTNDTAVSGELETSNATKAMNGSVVVSTPWRANVKFDVRASRIDQPGSRETFAGTLDGRKIHLAVAAKLGS